MLVVIIFKQEVIEKLIPEDKKQAIYEKIKGRFFVFDKESFNEYKKFSDPEQDYLHEIIIYNGYLAREWRTDGRIEFFHEWLMREEKEEFQKKTIEDVEIHHTTFCKRINIKKYLKIKLKKDHRKQHNGYSGLKYIEFEDD